MTRAETTATKTYSCVWYTRGERRICGTAHSTYQRAQQHAAELSRQRKRDLRETRVPGVGGAWSPIGDMITVEAVP